MAETVVSRTVITSAGMAIQGVARFAYTWVIANLVGPVEVGQTNTLLSVAVYAVLFWPQGAGIAATRFLPVPDEAGPAIRLLRRTTLLAMALLSALSAGVAWVLMSGDLIAAASCGVLVATYAGYVFTRGALLGRDQVLRATVGDAISSAVSLTALVLVVLGQVNWALLLPLAAGYLIFTALNWPRDVAAEPNRMLRREVLLFTRDNSIAVLASGGLLPATMVMVHAFDTPVAAGNFAVALSLATPASMLSQALNQVLVPHFARLRSTPVATIRASYLKILMVSAAGFVAVFGLLIWWTPWILDLFFGDRYAAGTTPMRVLLVIVCAMSLMAAPSAYLVTMGHQRRYASVWLVSLVVGTAVLLIASPIWGQWGALLGYGIGAGGGALAVIVLAFICPPRLPTSSPEPPAPAPVDEPAGPDSDR